MKEMINESTLEAHLKNGSRIMITCNRCLHYGDVDFKKLAKILPPETELLAPILTRLHSCSRCKSRGNPCKDLAFTLWPANLPSPPTSNSNVPNGKKSDNSANQ